MKRSTMMRSLRPRLILLAWCLALLLLGLITTTANGSSGAVVENNDDDSTESNDPQIMAGEADSESKRQGGGGGSSQSSSTGGRGNSNPSLVEPTLDSNSVVLITGAAGFIGSELALALRRTYNVKKLLLVDNLGIDSENESLYVPPTRKEILANNNGGSSKKAIYEILSEEELSMFEIKRQRAFRIFHELTAPSLEEDGNGNGGSNTKRGGINVGESIRFYRADMRPSIPEYFDFGEVPLLEGIFQSHPDITHVVHLADVPLSGQNQAIPRNKDSMKTGRMEGMLEEMRLVIERGAAASDGDASSVRLPQFVYASSHEVYDKFSAAEADKSSKPSHPNPPSFREDKPITTPSNLHGTAKLIDEVLASAYHSTHGIYSVGLRLFNVYGPWSSPGTEVFDLAEGVNAMNGVDSSDWDKDVNDYVYIDDAVDAIMSAMQYRPPGADPPPVVFNVGSGEGKTLGELRDGMAKHFPKLNAESSSGNTNPDFEGREATKSIASTSRSESLLGFQAQVSLEEGLAHTLTWHRDRSFPYGSDPTVEDSFERRGIEMKIAESLAKSRRIESIENEDEEGEQRGECSPLDRECLRGSPVFPCASECHRPERCTPSIWDDVAQLSKAVTSGCDAVLYTILLDDDAEQIPSAAASVNMDSLPYVGAGLPEDVGKRTQARCNLAFVSKASPLVKRLKSEGEEYVDSEEGDGTGQSLPPLLRHGFWTVLPVSTSSQNHSWLDTFGGSFALEYLPKVSPGRFFGSSVRYAIYASPSVIVDSLPRIIKRMEDGISSSSSPSQGRGSTALMLASKRPGCDPAQRGASCTDTYVRPRPNDMIQSRVYNMIRIALRGGVLGGGLEPDLDSSLVVHSLREEDSRLFRCDIYGEAAQWGVASDERALEFIISLHDLWSRAVVHWSTNEEPWWINVGSGTSLDADGGNNIDSNINNDQEQGRRQLQSSDQEKGGDAEKWMGVLSSTEVQLLTHIIPWDSMGVVHLDQQ